MIYLEVVKLKILKYSIFGMAQNQDIAKETLKRLSKTLNNHIIKCVVYKNILNDLPHWEKEIANFLSIANDIRLKPKNKKPKESMFTDCLFQYLGDGSINDARVNLSMFQIDFEDKYPAFEITEEMIVILSNCYQIFLSDMVDILAAKNDYTLSDILRAVEGIFAGV